MQDDRLEILEERVGGTELASGKGERAQQVARKKGVMRSHPYVVAVAGVGIAIALSIGVLWWLEARHFETTDDAFIDARQFSISPKVAGYIGAVAVTDNQYVEAGALVATIDDRDYRTAVEQAEAQVAQAEASLPNIAAQIAAQEAQVAQAEDQVASARASLIFARQQDDRYQTLLKTGATTLQNAQQIKSAFDQARAAERSAEDARDAAGKQVLALKAQEASAGASLRVVKIQLEQARFNLSYTGITAAQAGHVAHLSAAKGQYVQPGQSLMMFVPANVWVTANFKETQITDMHPGQSVDIEVDSYPDRTFEGHVASIQSGSGTAFSLPPAENATGNYVKVVQRVPVKIVFDHIPLDVVLGPGMSVVPKVRVR
jgi:membrane fusion protein, multidrug efflux system